MFGTTIFIFNALTTFSGQYMYSDVFMTLLNVFFTALTPLVIGIFDRDVDRHVRELGLTAVLLPLTDCTALHHG